MTRKSLLTVALLLIALPRLVLGQTEFHSITFDNGQTTTGSMSSTFDRDTAVFDWDGGFESAASSVSVDVPRYGHDVTVFGARTIETISGTAGSWRVYAAGEDSSGLPVVVVNYRGTPTLYIYRDGAPTSVLNSKTLLGGDNKPATSIGDLLAGEDDEEADYTHDPRGAACLPGIILVNCNVHKHDGVGSRTSASSYDIWGVSLCYSTDNGATWKLAWRSDDLTGTTPPTDYGSEWAITAVSLDRDGTEDNYLVCVASYSSGGDRGADGFACHLTGGSGSWSISKAKQMPVSDGADTSTHLHYLAGFVDPNNSSGAKFILEIGDAENDNRIEEWLLADLSAFETGGSDVSNAVNVFTGGSSWSGPTVINGSLGTMGPQTISYAPGPNGGWYAGIDEGLSGPIVYATVPATDGARVNYQDAHAIPGTSIDGDEHNWRCFTLNAWDYCASNPAVVAQCFPGGAWDTGNADAQRFLYKPANSTTFGVVYAAQGEATLGSQLRPVLSPAGYIWFGTGDNNGLRRFAVPSPQETRTQQAIYAGPGGENKVLGTPAEFTAPHASNTVTVGATPPVTFPHAGDVMYFEAAGSSLNMGHWRITGDSIANDTATITIQMLAYTDTDSGESDNDPYWRARFYTVEATSSNATGYIGPQRIEGRGKFTLLTWVITKGTDFDISGGDSAQRLVAQIQTSGGSAKAMDWYMQFVGVYDGVACPPSSLVPDETTGDAETLTLSGFTCGSNWSAYAIGVLGGDTGRDAKHPTADTFREFLTLREDSNTHIEVLWDADDQLRIVCTDGGSTDTETLTGLPKFLRGDPFIFAMSFDGTDYRYSLSVSGTVVQSGTISSPNAVVRPTELRMSQNVDGTVRETCRWLYGAVNDSYAMPLDGFVTGGALAYSSPSLHDRGRGRDWRSR